MSRGGQRQRGAQRGEATGAGGADPGFDVADCIPAAVAVISADDLTVLHVNPACAEFLDADPKQVRGRPVHEVLPTDGDSLLDLFRAARDARTVLCINNLRFLNDADPDRVWTLHLAPRPRSAKAKVAQLVLYLVDATERGRLVRAADRAAEEERQRAEQLDAVFASIADAVILVDDVGKMRKCNAAAVSLLGLGESSSLSIDSAELSLQRADGSAMRAHESPLAHALRGETVRGEEVAVLRPGQPRRIVSVSAAPVMADGNVSGAVAVLHDVTDIGNAEERLQRALEAERRRAREARTLYLAARAVSSDLNLRACLNLVAETMAEAVGVSRCSIMLVDGRALKVAATFGLSPQDARRVSAEALPLSGISAATRDAIDQGHPYVVDDAKGLPPASQRLARLMNMRTALVVPFVYGDRVTGIAYLDEPGTERSFPDTDRMIAMGIAAQGAVAIENARLYAAEQERARMLEFMMAELNHRVKNNLAIVCGLLALQLNESDPNATRESVLRDCMTRIRSISLIHEMLHADEPDAVDMREAARRIGAIVCEAFASPQQKIAYRVRGDRLLMPSKLATSLGLVINELVCNAVKHGLADRDAGRISVNISAGERIRISVSDDGRGIPADFDPQRDGHVGTLVTRDLLEKELGGSVAVRRNPRGGTTVVLVFPAPGASPLA
ncbi:MAG: PAS domain-containing protein [Armatimonadota bacterium]|nr:MAG: PAS domain-containing protein [Armatimonadota bacterium]